MPVPPASLRQRVRYGRRVVGLALGVLKARIEPIGASGVTTLPCNVMFSRDLVETLEPQRRALEAFDLYLFDIMNSVRLRGEKVFEYGVLLGAIRDWNGLRVLDVGTGRSTLPQWMTHQGAWILSLDLPAPAEDRWGGFQERVNGFVARRAGAIAGVAGSMRQLPCGDGQFDLVTSLSVVEHLDTNLPDRAVRAVRRAVLAACGGARGGDQGDRAGRPHLRHLGVLRLQSRHIRRVAQRLLLSRRPSIVRSVARPRREEAVLRLHDSTRVHAGRRRAVRRGRDRTSRSLVVPRAVLQRLLHARAESAAMTHHAREPLQQHWDARYATFSLDESGCLGAGAGLSRMIYRAKEAALRGALDKAGFRRDSRFRVLDMACGFGYFAGFYAAAFPLASYTGV